MGKSTRNRIWRIGAFFNRKSKASREQVAGIFRFAGEHPDWELHLFTRPDSPEEMRRIAASFTPDGIIAGHPMMITAFRQRFHRHIPGVLIDYATVKFPRSDARILCDDHAIGAHAAQAFIGRGYRSFAFAGIEDNSADSDAANSHNRENEFRRTLRKAGFECSVYHEHLQPNAWRYTDVTRLTEWLKSLPKPCAMLAHSDMLAQSVMTCCQKARIHIPEQVAIIGVDNEESVCESTKPTLSSIEPDFGGGGYQAARLLDGILRGSPSASTRATYGIARTVERMSTQNVTGAHLRIAKALELIRARSSAGLSPGDIADALGISTRMLELTFAKALGHSVRDELITVRLDEVKRLLHGTSLPFGEIAAASGFRTLAALKSIFRKRFGCSMRTFRMRQTP